MSRRANLTAALFVSVGVLYVGCTQNFEQFQPEGNTFPTTTSSSGSGGQGGMAPMPCKENFECTDLTLCTTDTCNTETGECENKVVADGPVPGMDDMENDCKDRVCQGGVEAEVPDDMEMPADDMNPCTTQACVAGTAMTTNMPADTVCGQGMGGVELVCNDMGICVGCTKDDQCPDVPECQVKSCTGDGQCVPENEPAGDECGSNDACNGMGACVDCLVDDDCSPFTSLACDVATNACVLSCPDGQTNGNETDVDCGGFAADCPPCGDGKKCENDDDCTSNVCSGGTCQVPTCNDGEQNGGESDTDCGNVCAAKKCMNGATCFMANDCVSNLCQGNAVKTCVACNTDGMKNGQEAGVDCGAACANKCPNGQMCATGNDCTSNICTNNVCSACNMDGMKNGLEDDVDCGGACATKCGDGKTCNAAGDCTSNLCQMNLCRPMACGNMMKDGNETDVDCGGQTAPTCQKCANGLACLVNADCVSNNCNPGQSKCQ